MVRLALQKNMVIRMIILQCLIHPELNFNGHIWEILTDGDGPLDPTAWDFPVVTPCSERLMFSCCKIHPNWWFTMWKSIQNWRFSMWNPWKKRVLRSLIIVLKHSSDSFPWYLLVSRITRLPGPRVAKKEGRWKASKGARRGKNMLWKFSHLLYGGAILIFLRWHFGWRL